MWGKGQFFLFGEKERGRKFSGNFCQFSHSKRLKNRIPVSKFVLSLFSFSFLYLYVYFFPFFVGFK